MTAESELTLPPETELAAVDAALNRLREHAGEWARLPIPRKIELLNALRPRIARVAGRWVEAASTAKGLEPGSPLRGEEWASGPWTLMYYLGPLASTLAHLSAGEPARLVAGRVRRRPDGQVVVRVVPSGLEDQLLIAGHVADVWMEPDVTPRSLPETIGVFYREPEPEGRVAAVLGAGNISSIAPLDVLYKLYAEGQVSVLKMNPVNSYLGPLLEEVFAEFVDAGYVRFVYGGVAVGTYLTRHREVDEIHVTGSADTFDAIVYGTGEMGRRRQERDEPEIDKRVTAELGGVGAIVVVPGPWSKADLDFQAEHVATMKMYNAGFNCVAGQVLVLPEEWESSDRFLGVIRKVLDHLPDRPAYYPGAVERLAETCEAYRDAVERLGASGSRVLIPHVESEASAQHAFTSEFFAGALAVTRLGGGGAVADPGEFLERAVEFCNERLVGSLAVSILIHPRTIRRLGGRLEDALARLRYGTIGVNAWTGVAFLMPQAAWGAFPGHARNDIQSGTGFVHNALLFDRPQKTVVRGTWAPFPRSLRVGELHGAPKPAWFVTNRNSEKTFRRVTEYTASRGALELVRVLASAYRG
jgi:aldehyde dehydrogenase (NAD(P)+)